MGIEPATTDDLDRLVDLWVDLAEEQRDHGSHLRGEANREPIRMTLAAHVVDDTLLVARRADGIAGFVAFEVERGRFEEDAVRGIVQNLYVVPDARNAGLGSELLTAAESALAAAGADVVALEAMADNDAARRFYRRRGYESHRIEYERPVRNDTHTREG